MAKINYQHEKRMKDLARKKKNEEKRLRKISKKDSDTDENSDEDLLDDETAEDVQEGAPEPVNAVNDSAD